MKCPECQASTDCVDSRERERYRYRRRKCTKCAHKFSTTEMDYMNLRAQIIHEMNIVMAPRLIPMFTKIILQELGTLAEKIEQQYKKELNNDR